MGDTISGSAAYLCEPNMRALRTSPMYEPTAEPTHMPTNMLSAEPRWLHASLGQNAYSSLQLNPIESVGSKDGLQVPRGTSRGLQGSAQHRRRATWHASSCPGRRATRRRLPQLPPATTFGLRADGNSAPPTFTPTAAFGLCLQQHCPLDLRADGNTDTLTPTPTTTSGFTPLC